MKIDNSLRTKVLLACESCYPHPLTDSLYQRLEETLGKDVVAGTVIYLYESGFVQAEYRYNAQFKEYVFDQVRITAKGLDMVFHTVNPY